MGTLRDLMFLTGSLDRYPGLSHRRTRLLVSVLISVFALVLAGMLLSMPQALAGGTHLPGDDVSDKLEAAGTLLKLIDTGIFKWGARVFAGLLVMSGGWALKEQRFGIAAICVAGAVVIGTTPKWVKNIFDVGDNQSLFTQAIVQPIDATAIAVARVDSLGRADFGA